MIRQRIMMLLLLEVASQKTTQNIQTVAINPETANMSIRSIQMVTPTLTMSTIFTIEGFVFVKNRLPIITKILLSVHIAGILII